MSSKNPSHQVTFDTHSDPAPPGQETTEPGDEGIAAAVAASSAATRERILRYSARGYSVYRHVLVQVPESAGSRESTLGEMVTARQRRELVLYMLILTAWPWLQSREKPFSSDVWTRALSIDADEADPVIRANALTWSASTLSRAWKALQDRGLIETRGKREKRWVRIIPRREDHLEGYTIPAGRRDRFNTYFTLPDRFWAEKDFARLTLPGLAMLLIIAKETSYKSEVWLTHEGAAKWYGVSRSTVQAGLKELDDADLLHTRTKWVPAPLSPKGVTQQTHYSLKGDYGYEARKALRAHAKTAGDERRRKAAFAEDSKSGL
jgi:DNA-binding transcriptional ArsR family regulator